MPQSRRMARFWRETNAESHESVSGAGPAGFPKMNEEVYPMQLRKHVITSLLASSLALGGMAAVAQDSTPVASPAATEREVSLIGADGGPVATALFVESDEGVTITIQSDGDSGLEPGEHGIHIHEFGLCTPTEGDETFSDAGGHFNPTDATHGGPEDEDSHAGDLGNLMVADDGTIDFEVTTDKVTLMTGEDNSLADEDGSAIVIHAGIDDLETDPSGESGDRVACGTIYQFPAPMDATPVATPDLGDDEEATPED